LRRSANKRVYKMATGVPSTIAYPPNDDLEKVATRTLLAAGYQIIGFQRLGTHFEVRCTITFRLGASLRFLFAFTRADHFSSVLVGDISHTAETQGFALVLVAASSAQGQISWQEFLKVMGGAVPSWRALQPNYESHLLTASRDQLPEGESGEAWLLFEDLVADGLEFLLGRKVGRYGGRRRGENVSDMIAALPDYNLLVVDAKASRAGFDAAWPALRPLVEYVKWRNNRGSLPASSNESGRHRCAGATCHSTPARHGRAVRHTLPFPRKFPRLQTPAGPGLHLDCRVHRHRDL